MVMLARIAWRKRTLQGGWEHGHGTFYNVAEVVQVHVDALNKIHDPEIVHWVETEASIEAAKQHYMS